jgi:hypothetical protein
MEFYVVDPKDQAFDGWVENVRGFFDKSENNFTEENGELYYIGDDVATPWREKSVLFTMPGDEGGIVEVRDIDHNFYVFLDDLDLFDAREIRDATGYNPITMGAVYGFEWASKGLCRFHNGPSVNIHHLCDNDDSDIPPVLALEDVWAQFFRAVYWLGGNTSRLQDLKGISVEKIYLDFEVNVDFTHPASLDNLFELLLDETGFERTKTGLRAVFSDRDLAWIQRFVSLLPTEEEDFKVAFFRAVWRGLENGKEAEVFHVGVEKRRLKPFIQMPVQRSSKAFVDQFKEHFSGFRVDRQEYRSDYKEV